MERQEMRRKRRFLDRTAIKKELCCNQERTPHSMVSTHIIDFTKGCREKNLNPFGILSVRIEHIEKV